MLPRADTCVTGDKGEQHSTNERHGLAPPICSMTMRKDANKTGWLQRLRGYRFSRLGIIPPETRVDPAAFSEDEFPVVCPQCNYQLRGLPHNTCPECGRPFDRGRLLVEQYVIERGKRHRCQTHKALNLAMWFIVAAVGVLSLAAMRVYKLILDRIVQGRLGSTRPLTSILTSVLYSTVAIAAVLLPIAYAIRKPEAKASQLAKRVFEGIDRDDPVFFRDPRWRWGALLLAWILILAIFGFIAFVH